MRIPLFPVVLFVGSVQAAAASVVLGNVDVVKECLKVADFVSALGQLEVQYEINGRDYAERDYQAATSAAEDSVRLLKVVAGPFTQKVMNSEPLGINYFLINGFTCSSSEQCPSGFRDQAFEFSRGLIAACTIDFAGEM